MLKNTKDILHKMGEAFRFANAGEMLSCEQKNEVLSKRKKPYPVSADVELPRVVLASDENFNLDSLERAITLCQEERAILDLLCVSAEGKNTNLNLATVLPRLGSETNLDFQVTHRQGNLLSVIDSYLRSKQDTLMIMININDQIRGRLKKYQQAGKWSRMSEVPSVEFIDTVLHG